MSTTTSTSGTAAPIGVIGATGKTGRRIVDRLVVAGVPVRRLARSGDRPFDWTRPGDWPRAVDGVRRLFVSYVPDLAAPGSDAAIAELVSVALDAGVERIVLLSGRGETGAKAAEDVVLASPIPSTIVRASWFVQNFTEGQLTGWLDDGVIAMPAGDRLEPFIDVDDIADVAVTALVEDGWTGRVIEVTGPELLGFADAAAVLSELAGRDVQYVPIDLDTFHRALTDAAGPEAADLLTHLCREVFDGRNEHLTTGVHEVLGRPPRSLHDALLADPALQR